MQRNKMTNRQSDKKDKYVKMAKYHNNTHCVKRVLIPSYSGPHFSRIFPHSGNNSEYGHFLRSD